MKGLRIALNTLAMLGAGTLAVSCPDSQFSLRVFWTFATMVLSFMLGARIWART